MSANASTNYTGSILQLINTGLFRQLTFFIGIALSVAAGVYFYMSMQDPMYRPLDYKVTEKNAASVSDILDKAHIKYKINDADGVILVAAKDAQTAKYKLAAGGIQKDDSLNFSYLNDQNAIGESQFIENARYLRALEGDLVKTIIAIDGITAAKVHIAMPSNNIFADEKGRPTASVFINVGNGVIADKEKVKSIIQIVASSVPGLDPKDVAITDQYGHYLTNAITDDSIISAEHLNYQNTIQSYYEKRIESLIAPIVGADRVNVRVHADIDFTQQEEANEKYDPNEKVLRSEQTTSEEVGSSTAGGPSGALANTPPEGGDGDSAGKNQSTSSQGRSQSIKNYELSKSVTYKKSNVANVRSLSVAVTLDNITSIDPKTQKTVSQPVSKEMIEKITSLVKATIGYEEKRGDIVTVVNSQFTVSAINDPMPVTHFWSEPWFWETVKEVGSLIFALTVFVVLYRKMSKMAVNLKVESTPSMGMNLNLDSGSVPEEMRQLKQEQINQLKEIASKDPNRVALVLKNWVAEK